MVAIFDPLFLTQVEVTAGLKKGGTIVANHREVKRIDNFKVYLVDATRIAVDNGLMVAGWAVVNTAMLGAIAKVLGNISKEAVEKVVRMRWSGELGDKNIKAALQAFGEVA